MHQSNTQIKPASLYKKDFINRIKTGNLTDDIEKYVMQTGLLKWL